MLRKQTFFLVILLFAGLSVTSQNFSFKKRSLVYKEIDGVRLEMVVYNPDVSEGIKLPAIVFFFGGGWVSGNTGHFQMQAEYLASRGMIAVCPDYRTQNKHHTSPFECVKDAKSAMRYLKQYGTELGIDTSRIVASGGSAGGHLAAGTAILKNINENTDNLKISTVPMALVLFNPVIDTSKRGYGQKKVAGREFEISPVHNVTAGLPPTLIMHGTADSTVPYENVVRFKQVMKQAGNECIVKAYKKQNHGFFNYGKAPKYFYKTLKETEAFLEELNLLKGESWVAKYYKNLKSKA